MPTPNPVLARQVLEHIEAHPEQWNQHHWALEVENECGTAYCFAGHVVRLAHPDATFLFRDGLYAAPEAHRVAVPGDGESYIKTIAKKDLGLTDYGADVMFEASNTLEHLREYVAQLEHPDADGELVCVNIHMGADDEDADYYDEDDL